MSTFDGEDFIKLDDDAFGFGTSGSTYPVDVFTQQRFVSNQQYMAQGLDGATLTYEIDLGTSFDIDSDQYRPFVTSQRATFLKIPWLLQSGLNQINIGGSYSARNAVSGASAQNNVSGTIQLLQRNNVIADEDVTFVSTYNGGSGKPCDINDFQFSLNFDQYSDSEQWGELRFYISNDEDNPYTQYDQLNLERESIGGGVTITSNNDRFKIINDQSTTGNTWSFPSNGPVSASWVNKSMVVENQTYDLLVGDFQNDTQEIWTHPIFANGVTNVQGQLYDLTMFHPRYLQIEPKYTKQSLITPRKEEIKAQKPVLGRTMVNYPASLSRMHRRSRLIGIGPSGNQDRQDEQWTSGFRRMWKTVTVGAGNTDPFISHGLTIDKKAASDVYVAFYVLAWADTIHEALGNYDVEYTVTLEQLDSGDSSWSVATELNTSTVEIPQIVYPAGAEKYFAVSPLFRTLVTSDRNNTPSFKDGLIYPRDQDLPTLVVAKINPGIADNYANPVRLQVQANFTAVTPIEQSTGNQIQLTCLGYSIWEKGSL